MNSRFLWLRFIIAITVSLSLNSASLGQVRQPLSAEQRKTFDESLRTLQESLDELRDRPPCDLADAAVFPKGLAWALRYNHDFSPDEVKLLETAVTRGGQRAGALAAGKQSWSMRKGKLVLGYVSRVDGSVQPIRVWPEMMILDQRSDEAQCPLLRQDCRTCCPQLFRASDPLNAMIPGTVADNMFWNVKQTGRPTT